MPGYPSIPLPEPIAKACQFVSNLEAMISPLMRPLNRIIIVLSLSGLVGGERFSDYLALRPSNIIGGEVTVPYVWTLFTSVLYEPNPLFMLLYLAVMNYVVACNRRTFEAAWRSGDFYALIIFAGSMASLTHLGLRISMQAITNDGDYSHASINFIVMVLLMGLR